MAKRLKNGNILIPIRVKSGSIIGDAWEEISPGHKEYPAWDRYLDRLESNDIKQTNDRS